MGLQVRAATSAEEPRIVELFTELQVTIDSRFWERAFSPTAPEGSVSRAAVVVDDAGELFAYGAARPIELYVEGEYTKSQVLHDVVVRPGLLETEAAGLLTTDLMRRADVTVCAGASLELTRLIERLNFLRAGFFGRAVYDPHARHERKDSGVLPFQLAAPAGSLAGLALEGLNGAFSAERKIFRRRSGAQLEWLFRGPAASEFEILVVQDRSEMDAYAALRKAPGRAGEELLVVDAACPSVDVPRLASALVGLSRLRGQPLFISLFGDSWAEALVEAGFVAQRPRWPLHWILRDPRHRATGTTLLRREAWFLTAADGEVDRW